MDRMVSYPEPYDAVIQAGYGEHGREGLQELAVREDHAEMICLGCGGMAELGEKVRSQTGAPVVDGVAAAVTIAESLVRLRLTTSKVRTYAPPRPKRLTGWPISRGT